MKPLQNYMPSSMPQKASIETRMMTNHEKNDILIRIVK